MGAATPKRRIVAVIDVPVGLRVSILNALRDHFVRDLGCIVHSADVSEDGILHLVIDDGESLVQ